MKDAPDSPSRECPVSRRTATWAGYAFVGLAAVGTVVPGLPTTIFLIAAMAFFARGRPDLQDRVMDWRIFRPFRPFVLGDAPLPRRHRNGALVGMWTAILASSLFALHSVDTPDFVAWTSPVLGCVGTVAILRWAARRGEPRPS